MPEPTSTSPDVRVVCVVFNPGDELRAFAESLRRATARTYELVLVDNGDPSDVVAELRAAGATVLRHPDGNVGYGAAGNLVPASL